MKHVFLFASIFVLLVSCSKDTSEQNIITSDITNYWKAYDKIISTQDSTLQSEYLKTYFIDKASEGQKAMFQARRYQPEEYIQNINNFPNFWKSIRENTLKASQFGNEINSGIQKLQEYYPELKPGKVYFTMGAFRSPGTTLEGKVLIGSEMILTDENTNTSEFPQRLNYFSEYCKNNPIKEVEFLNVHEFIHTQQGDHDYVLIYRTVYEGIAEFVAEIVSGKKSTSPAIAYGKENDEFVKTQFRRQAFSPLAVDDWMYNSRNNIFGERDLGYYVGYAICERIYAKSTNKKQTVKEMIELDYTNETAFFDFVDSSEYFDEPVANLKEVYKTNVPRVVSIKEFENNSQSVDPTIKQVTVEFSSPMQRRTGFDLGPLGMDALLRVKRLIGFSEDMKSVTFEVALKPNTRYQLALGSNFRNEDGVRLPVYLIDFKTSK